MSTEICESETLCIRLDKDSKQKLKMLAKENKISVSCIVKDWIDDNLQSEKEVYKAIKASNLFVELIDEINGLDEVERQKLLKILGELQCLI